MMTQDAVVTEFALLRFFMTRSRLPQEKKGLMAQHRMRGFSLVEMMAVLAIIFIVTAMSMMTLQPELKAQRVSNAYNITLMAMRQARDTAVAQRQTYYVTFTHNTIPP